MKPLPVVFFLISVCLAGPAFAAGAVRAQPSEAAGTLSKAAPSACADDDKACKLRELEALRRSDKDVLRSKPAPAPTYRRKAAPKVLVPNVAAPSAAPPQTSARMRVMSSEGVIASRAFVEPQAYPPQATAAYGIVAFPQTATAETLERQIHVCEAYVASLPLMDDVPAPTSQQMVTVWPVSKESAKRLNTLSRKPSGQHTACQGAVENYSLLTALQALRDAEIGAEDFKADGDGPYLVAWAPSSMKGQRGIPVLVMDLSGIENTRRLHQVFKEWREKIELNPELWETDIGWSMDKVKLVVAEWAEKYGPTILHFYETATN